MITQTIKTKKSKFFFLNRSLFPYSRRRTLKKFPLYCPVPACIVEIRRQLKKIKNKKLTPLPPYLKKEPQKQKKQKTPHFPISHGLLFFFLLKHQFRSHFITPSHPKKKPSFGSVH